MDPNDIIDLYGADTARWFMLSDSPPERDLQWAETGVVSSHKFINRIWELVLKVKDYNTMNTAGDDVVNNLKAIINDVTTDNSDGKNIVEKNL